MRKRLEYFDIVKGISIFLVVWMHCIQYIAGQTFDNLLYTKVYSFHMPVFMIISGYFFFPKLEDNIFSIFKKQFIHLIIPTIVWGGIELLFFRDITINRLLYLPFSFWFLSSLFLSSLLYRIFYVNWTRSFPFGLLIITFFLSFISLIFRLSEFLSFFIPFFGFGIILAKKNYLSLKPNCYIFSLELLISILLLYCWTANNSIYITPNPIIGQLMFDRWYAYIMRLLTGAIVSISIIHLFLLIQHIIPSYLKTVLCNMSRISLAIYIIHLFVLRNINIHYVFGTSYVTNISTFFISCIIIIILYYLIIFLGLHKLSSILFLGKY